MYHEVTEAQRKQAQRRRIGWVLACFLLVAAIACGMAALRQASREQGAQALRQSILAAATRCCAVEGSYPTSLKHLEEDYGLTINNRDYVVTYEAFSGNLVPSVVVVPR